MTLEMDRGPATDGTLRIFRPTILLHHAGETSQSTAERNGMLLAVRERLPAYNCILFPWSQIPGATQFGISNLLGPKSKGRCPLGCSKATCPDQTYFQTADTQISTASSPDIENNNGADKRCTEHQSAIKQGDQETSMSGKESNREVLNETGQVTTRIAKNSTRRKKYQCSFCTVTCGNLGQLKGHLRCHTGERPFVCNVNGCSRKFARNEELTRHKRIHTGVRPFLCDICNKAFGRRDHLQKHSKTHLTPNEKKSHLCPVCCQGYSRSDALKRHKATAHVQLSTKS